MMTPRVLVSAPTVGLMILTECSDWPAGMLPDVAPRVSETPGNKIPASKVRMPVTAPNILVVEDDRETRLLIAKYLRNNACHVTTAALMLHVSDPVQPFLPRIDRGGFCGHRHRPYRLDGRAIPAPTLR
jgi:hypothetical protein